MNMVTGLQRVFLCIVVTFVAGDGLYLLGERLIFPRRTELFPVEIIAYIVAANIITLLAIYIAYKMIRWIADGFWERRKISHTPKEDVRR